MDNEGDELITHMVIQEDLLVAVTSTGRLFYWNKFEPLHDRGVALTDDQMYDERFIDTVYLNQDSDRVVMMALVCGSEAAMVLDSKLALVPADCSEPKNTGEPHNYYLRVTTDCHTVIRINKSYSSHQANKTPRLEIYSLSDSEPSFRVEPLSESLNDELGNFVDIWANKYSLVYFGVDGIVQVRFDNSSKETDVNDEAVTSSHYISINYRDSREVTPGGL
uniref:Uncharacterized protein n=1 Tax=Clarireedia homoeocarpa TaxID=1436886 RepID=A0A0K0M9J2_9HELO|nr:hypothetical protein [Clarireedia homoeocarpa]